MYYLLLAIFYPISLLPLWVLYGLSDLAYLVVFRGMGYRKDIVRSNLTHAFPAKSAEEIELIMRRFYHSFCDQWVETIKMLTISDSEMNKRMKGNWEILQSLDRNGKNAYLLAGHIFNWEWGNMAMRINTGQMIAAFYLPLSSPAFDRLMLRIRCRKGSVAISMKNIKGGLRLLQGKTYLLGIIADQNPSVVEVAEWIPFMHREAPFFRGPEQMPRRAKAAIVLYGIHKIKRGYYQVTLEQLTEDASQMEPGAILKAYVHFLEKQLNAQPENYLWSHRRWKHQRKTSVS